MRDKRKARRYLLMRLLILGTLTLSFAHLCTAEVIQQTHVGYVSYNPGCPFQGKQAVGQQPTVVGLNTCRSLVASLLGMTLSGLRRFSSFPVAANS
jgi:hypothetical protein